jgi:glucose-6-phosphate isomerase
VSDARTGAARAFVAAGALAERVAARIAAFRAADWHRRLLARDTSLWGDEPARREAIGQRLGWVNSATTMREQAGAFTAFAGEVRAAGFTRVLLLGMGGSSLAPEVLAHTFGVPSTGLPLTVLDDTSPAAVRAALADHDPARTLVLVASKSGGTVEVTSFERACFARAAATLGARAGDSFVAITDPGTALAAHARERGYRRCFTNPADIGGRFSVLSCFGLVPAALLGLDPTALCTAAESERAAFAADGGAVLEIGAALGELALAGRDKLTLVLSPEWAALGAWIEQLVAESTGKQGRGVLPVDGEPLGEPSAYGDDRVFVSVAASAGSIGATVALDRLAAAGHPVIRWTREPHAIGAEFMRWELVTAVAAAVLGVNPFDEPNVAEAKSATKQVLAEPRAGSVAATPRARSGPLTLDAPDHVAVAGEPRDWAAALLAWVRPGDYAAILAWLHRTPARHEALERLRLAIARSTRAATTLGYGPRYLHSTGQLHKGGAANGVFLQLTAGEGDVEIPGEAYGFRVLHAAQAAGDLRVLTAHGLRVVRVHLGEDPDAGLEQLVAAFEQAGAVHEP